MRHAYKFMFTLVAITGAFIALFFSDDIPSGLPTNDQHVLRVISVVKHLGTLVTRLYSLITFTHPTIAQRIIREKVISPVFMKVGPAIKKNDIFHEEVLNLDGVPGRSFVHASRKGDKNLPGVIFVHGGGWAYGSSIFYRPVLIELISRLNNSVKIISIDYRLVPEFVYPVQFEDCLKAVKYILNSPTKFQLNPQKILIAGDSAGGNLALSVALRLREENATKVSLKSQVLVYPATHAINYLTKSFRENENSPILDKSQAIQFVLDYMDEDYTIQTEAKVANNRHVSDALRATKQWKYAAKFNDPLADHTVTPSKSLIARMESKLRDPYLFPFMAEDLSFGLPKTFVLTCEFDVLRDDGMAFVARMRDEAGENIVHENIKCFHGSLNFYSRTITGNDVMNMLVKWIGEEIGGK